MQNYYFILGRENKISQAEIRSVLANFCFGFGVSDISILSDDVLEIKLETQTEKVADLINVLGGTIKIFQKIAPRDDNILTLLKKQEIKRKVLLGISNYQKKALDPFRLALEVKRNFPKPLRIIAGKDNDRLSSAQSFIYKMATENIEYGLFETGIGKLIAVQNVDDWSRRDYDKPHSDAKSGLLPPKLARMMVNIAVGNSSTKKPLVADPFCGSGNLLLEALIVGYDVIGIDISEKAISDSQKNIDWLKQNYLIESDNKLIVKDARKFDFGSVKRDFVIVSEPYLGQPRRSKLQFGEEQKIKTELNSLYLNFLTNLQLTADSSKLKVVLIVFPLFELANGKQFSVFESCVDSLKEIGYTTVCPPLKYGRDYQVVKRELAILKQNGA